MRDRYERGERMIITDDGYSLQYERRNNKISILLPQTVYTLTDTVNPVVDRRTDVEEADLTVLLEITRIIFHKGGTESENIQESAL